MTSRPVNRAHRLPGALGEIAEIAGLDAALAVAAVVGGTRAYIARDPGRNHWLVRAVGAEAAAVIVDHFTTGRSGVEIEFPVGPRGSYVRERRARARRLVELTAQGLSNDEVAKGAGITRRGVLYFKAKRRRSKDRDQGDLGF